MNKPPRPQEPVLWQVLDAARELETRLEGELAGINLSMAKVGVLRILADAKEPLPLSELATHSQCVRSNMTQLVDRLEADGLVKRVSDEHDRRIRRAALTAAGRKACEEGMKMVHRIERETSSALSESDAAQLAQALGRLCS